jgi:hypothetical protein
VTTTRSPTPIQMVEDLHRAVFGDTWARPESPQQVWELLLGNVRGLASGLCGECLRRGVGGVDRLRAALQEIDDYDGVAAAYCRTLAHRALYPRDCPTKEIQCPPVC